MRTGAKALWSTNAAIALAMLLVVIVISTAAAQGRRNRGFGMELADVTSAAKAIVQYGGRYLVRGGAAEVAEGGPPPKTLIVVEFPSMVVFVIRTLPKPKVTVARPALKHAAWLSRIVSWSRTTC